MRRLRVSSALPHLILRPREVSADGGGKSRGNDAGRESRGDDAGGGSGGIDAGSGSRGSDAGGDLTAARFGEQARATVDWIERYLIEIERYPVLSRVKPGDLRAALPASPPAEAEPFDRILADFDRLIVPAVTHWNHPGFMAYFAISGSVPGILGEMLTSALNVNGMLWRTSPAATEVEELSLSWLRQMLGLSGDWWGMITDTASISTLLALAAARERPAELRVRELGLSGRPELPAFRVYASEEAHSSVDKAVIALGIGAANLVRVSTDDAFRMDAGALRAAIAHDRAAGRRPLAVVATVGTTSTTSVDPVAQIAEICRSEAVWLHVDAAYGGAAAVVPELGWVMHGADRADSLVVNAHKWLFTPMDCSALYTRHPEVLRRAFSLVPEYLATTGEDDAINLMDYGVQLGRRFRALKLWMVIRAFGADGLASRIRRHVELAQEFATWVSAEPEWRVVAPHPLSVVCFRFEPPGAAPVEADDINARVMEVVNSSGEIYLSHTKLRGRYVLRLAIGNLGTEHRHVARAWELLRAAAAADL